MGNFQSEFIYFGDGFGVVTEKLLAEGAFGYVYSAVHRQTNQKYALKKVIIPLHDTLRIEACYNEISIMSQLASHCNIIRFHRAISVEHPADNKRIFYILSELCPSTVWHYLQEHAPGTISEHILLSMFADMVMAVHHLHSQAPPIAHRDIKIENFLLTSTHVKLCDFGSCTTHHYTPSTTAEILAAEDDIACNTTMPYRAPEQVNVYLGHGLTEKVDIWALGVLLYVMATYSLPFQTNHVTEPLAILNNKFSWLEHVSYSADYSSLIRYLMHSDPAHRPSIYDVLTYVMNQKQDGKLKHWPKIAPSAVWQS